MYRKLLANRNFRLLWLLQALSTLGVELFGFSVMVTVFEQTASTLQTVGVMVANTLPGFLLSPFAGIIADRYPRKWVVAGTLAVRGLLMGVALLLLFNGDQVWVTGVYLITMGLSVATTLYRPAQLAILPDVVSKTLLVRANSLLVSSNQILAAMAYAIGGLLVLRIGLQQVTIGFATILLLSAMLATQLRFPKRADVTTEEKENMWHAIVAGIRYARHHPIAAPLIVMETLEHIPHGIWTGAIMLAFTQNALQSGAEAWGYQVSGWYVGQIIGATVAVGIAGTLARFPGWTVIINAFSSGVLTILYAGSPNVPIAVFLAVLFGPPFALRDVAQDSLLQAKVDKDVLGRVYATRETLRYISFMASGLFFAWLTDLISTRTIYFVGGILYLLTAIFALSNRALRQSRLEQVALSD